MACEPQQYTPQQVRALYQALLDEKNKVQLLTEQSKSSEEALLRLKKMLETSKNESIQQVKTEKEQLQLALQESRFHSQQVEKGVDFLRAKLHEAKTDRELLKEELQTTRQELDSLQNQFETLKMMVKKSKNECAELTEELQQTQKQLEAQQAGRGQIAQLEQRIEQLLREMAQLIQNAKIQYKQECMERETWLQEKQHLTVELEQEKFAILIHEQKTEKLTHEINLLKIGFDEQKASDQRHFSMERQKYQNEFDDLRGQYEELHIQLKVAQQHLAKKIKEASLLGQQIESEKEEKEQSEKRLNQLRTKYNEMEKLLEGWQKRQEEIKENLRLETEEKLKTHQKYFELNEKYDRLEKENKHLKKTQERYLQLQQLINGAKEEESYPPPTPTQNTQHVSHNQNIEPILPQEAKSSMAPRHYHDYDH